MAAPVIVNVSGAFGPFAAGSTPVYQAQIVDVDGQGVPASLITALTLSIADVLTGAIINGVTQVNILNTGRGTVDAEGNLTITLVQGDTGTSEYPGASMVERALVVDVATRGGLVNRHQVNFNLLALLGP